MWFGIHSWVCPLQTTQFKQLTSCLEPFTSNHTPVKFLGRNVAKTINMSLNAHDKAAVKALWGKIASSKDVIGVEAIYRMLQVYPQTKIYFSHWKDLSKNSAELKTQARTVTDAIGEAVANIDDIPAAFIQHSELHAFQLRVDPTNFKDSHQQKLILSHNLLVAIAILFPKEFTPEAHVAVDKFLANVASALSERYR